MVPQGRARSQEPLWGHVFFDPEPDTVLPPGLEPGWMSGGEDRGAWGNFHEQGSSLRSPGEVEGNEGFPPQSEKDLESPSSTLRLPSRSGDPREHNWDQTPTHSHRQLHSSHTLVK